MPIVPSRAERIRALLGQLASDRPADRDSAVAQLILQGPRVLTPLLASLAEAPTPGRLAALDVLERLDDRRVVPALVVLAEDSSLAVALRALEVLGRRPDPRSLPTLARVLDRGTMKRRRAAVRALVGQHGAGLVEALDPLVDTLVDEDAATTLRLAVMDALLRIEPPLPRSTLRPLGRRLASSGNPDVTSRASELEEGGTRRSPARRGRTDPVERLASGEVDPAEARKMAAGFDRTRDAPLEGLHEALERARDPRAVQALAVVLGTVGGPASIPVLSRSLARLTEAGPTDEDPDSGLSARAALHSALAALDSGLALHDLRELIARHPRAVMPALLQAATRVGNASLVPALAQAASEDPTLLEACTSTYAAIARRAKLRRSSVALRRVRAAHRPALEAFLARPARGRR